MVKKKSTKKTTAKKTTSKAITKTKVRKKKITNKPLGTCFVLMPFREPFNIYYNSIFKPAIKSAQLKAVRADDLFRPSVIVSDLWQMVQDAKVLLAELTTKNANVFYELGLAHAIGKPVVLVSETMDDVPFDLQQLRVLLYDKDDPAWGDKLSQGIKAALEETISSPVDAVPIIFRKKVKSQAPKQDEAIVRIEALERNIRLLNAPIKRGKSKIPEPEYELHRVSSNAELKEWALLWHKRGYSVANLKSMITREENIPDGEEEYIEMFKNSK